MKIVVFVFFFFLVRGVCFSFCGNFLASWCHGLIFCLEIGPWHHEAKNDQKRQTGFAKEDKKNVTPPFRALFCEKPTFTSLSAHTGRDAKWPFSEFQNPKKTRWSNFGVFSLLEGPLFLFEIGVGQRTFFLFLFGIRISREIQKSHFSKNLEIFGRIGGGEKWVLKSTVSRRD